MYPCFTVGFASQMQAIFSSYQSPGAVIKRTRCVCVCACVCVCVCVRVHPCKQLVIFVRLLFCFSGPTVNWRQCQECSLKWCSWYALLLVILKLLLLLSHSKPMHALLMMIVRMFPLLSGTIVPSQLLGLVRHTLLFLFLSFSVFSPSLSLFPLSLPPSLSLFPLLSLSLSPEHSARKDNKFVLDSLTPRQVCFIHEHIALQYVYYTVVGSCKISHSTGN